MLVGLDLLIIAANLPAIISLQLVKSTKIGGYPVDLRKILGNKSVGELTSVTGTSLRFKL